jgi:hypothetical protein
LQIGNTDFFTLLYLVLPDIKVMKALLLLNVGRGGQDEDEDER